MPLNYIHILTKDTMGCKKFNVQWKQLRSSGVAWVIGAWADCNFAAPKSREMPECLMPLVIHIFTIFATIFAVVTSICAVVTTICSCTVNTCNMYTLMYTLYSTYYVTSYNITILSSPIYPVINNLLAMLVTSSYKVRLNLDTSLVHYNTPFFPPPRDDSGLWAVRSRRPLGPPCRYATA